jgi:tetratricopeptide (TPR) repeat protein
MYQMRPSLRSVGGSVVPSFRKLRKLGWWLWVNSHTARLSQRSKAIADYQQAIHIDPRLEEAHFRLGQVYRQAGEAEKSKEELRIHRQLAQESAQQIDRERHEIRQFVIRCGINRGRVINWRCKQAKCSGQLVALS